MQAGAAAESLCGAHRRDHHPFLDDRPGRPEGLPWCGAQARAPAASARGPRSYPHRRSAGHRRPAFVTRVVLAAPVEASALIALPVSLTSWLRLLILNVRTIFALPAGAV